MRKLDRKREKQNDRERWQQEDSLGKNQINKCSHWLQEVRESQEKNSRLEKEKFQVFFPYSGKKNVKRF